MRDDAHSAQDTDELIRATAPRLFRLAVRLTGSLHDAEDVVQESYLQAVKLVRTGRFEGRAAIETWLYRVVVTQSLKAVERRRRAQPPPPVPSDPARAEWVAELAVLRSWLEQLPPDQRAALVLKELEGLSTAEIATALDCSEGAVEQRLVRARATLRARYAHG